MITCLLLAVVVVTFTGLAYPAIPVTTVETSTSMTTNAVTAAMTSYSSYMAINIITYSTTSTVGISTLYGTYCGIVCYMNPVVCGYETNSMLVCFSGQNVLTIVTQSTYETQNTAPVPYSQTLYHTLHYATTTSSTSLAAEYSSLGLTGAVFGVLSILVIGILAFATAWIALKHRTQPTSMTSKRVHSEKKEAVSAKNFCIECGTELPLDSKFCNECGTKQP